MTDKITPEKIAELREAIALQEYNLPLRSSSEDQTDGNIYPAKRGKIRVDAQYWGGLCKYIVSAVNALPDLLDEVERLRGLEAENTRLRATLREIAEWDTRTNPRTQRQIARAALAKDGIDE